MKKLRFSFFIQLLVISLPGMAFAHDTFVPNPLGDTIASYSMKLTLFAFALVIILLLVSVKTKTPTEAIKGLLFWSIAGVVTITTIGLAYMTIHLNSSSVTKGPVHWHADYEVWACGKKLDLINPTGLSNKIGTPTLHEHNDNRIHLEGVVIDELDASIGNFFHVIGGDILSEDNDEAKGFVTLPTLGGNLTYHNGDPCDDGTVGELEVFVYRTHEDQTYSWEKLTQAENYVIAPESQVPAGDCIVIEFESPNGVPDRLCRSYEVAVETGKLKGEANNGN